MSSLDRARAVLLNEARERAGEIVATARQTAAGDRRQAGAEAFRLEAEAVAEGHSAGATAAARELASARRRGRERVLAERRRAYARAREGALAAALELRSAPDYQGLLDGLERTARKTLGEEASVVRDVGSVGGVSAESLGRSLDLTLPALVERCLEDLGPELGEILP